MSTRVQSFVLQGIDASPCEVEVDCEESEEHRIAVVGLPDAAVRESVERVRSSILHAGYLWPASRLTINLAPADVRKEGPVYDLPIAIAILFAFGVLRESAVTVDPHSVLFAGELALDGRVRPIRGATSLAMMARERGAKIVVIPERDAASAAIVPGVRVVPVGRLEHVVEFLLGQREIEAPVVDEAAVASVTTSIDFADVRGQDAAKRALAIAAAGGHNALMIGPAGSGKTMMARALPGILPPLTRDEALEVTRIWSAIGAVPEGAALMSTRPVRMPHHTASAAAIVGGGSVPRPGEISLAHHGVLFLDELPEFSRAVLESLREPLEDGHVTIARAAATLRFPARVMLIAAMNPTVRARGGTSLERQALDDGYLARLSGPLVDRIDLQFEVPAVPFDRLAGAPSRLGTAALRERVIVARARQHARQGDVLNARLGGAKLDELVRLDDAARALLREAIAAYALSARAYDKLRRISRTIADLDGHDDVAPEHVAEAIGYRLLDRLLATRQRA